MNYLQAVQLFWVNKHLLYRVCWWISTNCIAYTTVSRCIKNWKSFPRVTEIRDFVVRSFKDPCRINSSFTNYWKTAAKFVIVSKLYRWNIIWSANSVWMEWENGFVYEVFTLFLLQKRFHKLIFGESSLVA